MKSLSIIAVEADFHPGVGVRATRTGRARRTHGILGHGEKQVSLPVVLDLRDGALMALQ